jgi:CcmD family protein
MTQGQYIAVAYAVVFVFVLAYVAIIAAKLARLQRETAELLELVRDRDATERRSSVSTVEARGEP